MNTHDLSFNATFSFMYHLPSLEKTFFFVSRLLGILLAVGGFKKKLKNDTERERMHVSDTLEHERVALHARITIYTHAPQPAYEVKGGR